MRGRTVPARRERGGRPSQRERGAQLRISAAEGFDGKMSSRAASRSLLLLVSAWSSADAAVPAPERRRPAAAGCTAL